MEIKEATKNPIWAKLNNIPLEASSNKGIGALASSLGKPLRMVNTTAKVCQSGMGRGEYTRVLVEFDVNKGFKDEICILYKNKENQNVVRVYDGKNGQGETSNEKRNHNCEEEGFIEVNYSKNIDKRKNGQGFYNNNQGSGKDYENNEWNKNGVYRRKEGMNDTQKDVKRKDAKDKPWKAWTSLNKFVGFEKNDTDEQQELNQLKDTMIVDQYLNKKLQPSCSETNNWSKDMIYYFKIKWEEDRAKEKEGND
nr:hypothetical protein [Tanacetum cinerariifolium]